MPPRERSGSSSGAVAARPARRSAPSSRAPSRGCPRRAWSAWPVSSPQHLVLEVVVLEVLARQGAHRRGQAQHAPRLRVELRVVAAALAGLRQQRQQVLAVVAVAHAPRAVVEADARDVELLRVEPGGLGELLREDDRALAERDERDVGVVGHRLGDDVDRVRVVEDPRAGAGDRDVVEDPLHHLDRAQRHEEAARTLRLLADHAVRERDPLVEHARLEAAGAVAGQDRVAVRRGRRGGRWSRSP